MRNFSTKSRPWFSALILSLCLNVLFVVLLFSSNLFSRTAIRERVRQGFISGELTEKDYLPYDTTRGWHQYNDCNILQMLTNDDESFVGRALGPWIHWDSEAKGACRTLQNLVFDGSDPGTFVSTRYTRYWHGYIPVTAAFLSRLDISTARAALRALVYAAVLLLLFSAFLEARLLPIIGPLVISAGFFWGVPYYGLGLSHALGDAAVLLGLAYLCFSARWISRPIKLLPFCAAFGAIVVYFEMLTGPLPTAAGLLFPTAYILSRVTKQAEPWVSHFGTAIAATVAFAVGVALTITCRIAVAASVVEPSGLDVFVGNTGLYTSAAGTDSRLRTFLQALHRLVLNGTVLTHGSTKLAAALYLSSAAGWFTALWLASKNRNHLAWSDFAAFGVGATSILVWVYIFPAHTVVRAHSVFMSRILIVPSCLGWAAVLWQLRLSRNDKQ